MQCPASLPKPPGAVGWLWSARWEPLAQRNCLGAVTNGAGGFRGSQGNPEGNQWDLERGLPASPSPQPSGTALRGHSPQTQGRGVLSVTHSKFLVWLLLGSPCSRGEIGLLRAAAPRPAARLEAEPAPHRLPGHIASPPASLPSCSGFSTGSPRQKTPRGTGTQQQNQAQHLASSTLGRTH